MAEQEEGTDLYKILGVERSATEDEIRRAYRKLALKHHPDKNLGDDTAAERFKQINRAKQILTDAKKRKMYDQHGDMGIKLAEELGDDAMDLLMMVDNWWCKALCVFCGVITLCYCCCCACCCCAPCRKPKGHDGFEEMPEDDDENEVITTQPSSEYRSFEDAPQVPTPGEPIVLGP